MRNIFIPFSFVLAVTGLSIPARAQDKIITKDGEMLQGWNV